VRATLRKIDLTSHVSTLTLSRASAAQLLSYLPQLDHQTAILNDVDSGAGELLGSVVVANAELKPNRLRLLRDDVIDVRRNVMWPAKDIHHVDLAGNLGDRAVDPLASISLASG